MLRTIAIWNRKLYIVVPLCLMSLGQWAILFHGVATVHSSWVAAAGGCVVESTSQVFIELIYLYSKLLVSFRLSLHRSNASVVDSHVLRLDRPGFVRRRSRHLPRSLFPLAIALRPGCFVLHRCLQRQHPRRREYFLSLSSGAVHFRVARTQLPIRGMH